MVTTELPATPAVRPIPRGDEDASYSDLASQVAPSGAVEIAIPHRPRSMADFVQALEIFANDSAVRCESNGRRRGAQLMIFVNRPYSAWLHVFGKPQMVENHYDLFTQRSFTTWIHPCDDGVAVCTGDLYRHPSGRRWISVGTVRLHASLKPPLPKRTNR